MGNLCRGHNGLHLTLSHTRYLRFVSIARSGKTEDVTRTWQGLRSSGRFTRMLNNILCDELFAGIGGFALGFHMAGIGHNQLYEKCRYASGVLSRRFPNIDLKGDVQDYDQTNSISIVSGGPPCQGFSLAGHRQGLDDDRSGNFFEFVHAVNKAQPQYFIMENVPGMFSSSGFDESGKLPKGSDFATVLSLLTRSIPTIPTDGWKRAGFVRGRTYNVCWRVLDSQYFGVPQRRRRVFVVGSRYPDTSCAQILFEQERSNGYFKSGKEEGYYNTKRITGGTRRDSVNAYRLNAMSNDISTIFCDILPTLKYSSSSVPGILYDFSHSNDVVRTYNDISNTLSARMGTGGNQVAMLLLPQKGLRKLTPVECERVQGFPDKWTDGQSNTRRYQQLGNAVSVPVSHWLGLRFHMVIHGHNENWFLSRWESYLQHLLCGDFQGDGGIALVDEIAMKNKDCDR